MKPKKTIFSKFVLSPFLDEIVKFNLILQIALLPLHLFLS